MANIIIKSLLSILPTIARYENTPVDTRDMMVLVLINLAKFSFMLIPLSVVPDLKFFMSKFILKIVKVHERWVIIHASNFIVKLAN